MTRVEAALGRWLGVAAVAAVAALCYAGALDHAFVFDDVKLVVENETIRDLGNVPSILGAAFTREPYLARDHWIDPGYRPVRMISYALDVALHGDAPRSFRFTNIFLHVLNALLAGAIAARLIGRPARFPAALLFVAHPLATEAVTYISGRRDVLFALFYLAAFVLFLDHRARPARWRAAAIGALFVLALGAKEMAVTLPLACIGIDLALGGPRSVRARVRLHGALFAIAAAYSALVVFGKNPGDAGAGIVVERIGGGVYAGALTMARVVVHYAGLVLFPGTLCADYSFDAFPASRGLFDPFSTIFALAGLAAAGFGVFDFWRKGARVEAFLGAFFVVALLPVLQIVPHPEPIAERYLYVPLLFPILLALRGLVIVARAGLIKTVYFAIVLAVAALAIRTIERNRDWRDEETLFASVVRTHPSCARANLAAAKSLIARGQDLEALDPLDRCISVLPQATWDTRAGGLLVTALFERAKARAEVGLHDEALRDLDHVLRERTTEGEVVGETPRFAHVRLNRAATLKRRAGPGDAKAAAREYEAVIALLDRFDPPDAGALAAALEARREAEIQLGLLAIERGEKDAGLARLEAAGGPPPPMPATERAWDIHGRAALEARDLPRAERVFRALVQARLPGEKQAWYRLAETLDRKGDILGARTALDRAVEIDPLFAPAHFTLGDLALRLGDLDTAQNAFGAVLAAKPDARPALLKLTEVALRRAAPASATGTAAPPGLDPPTRPRQKAERLVEIARRAWHSNQPTGALRALELAEEADKTWSEPAFLTGAVLESIARPEAAAEAYERALRREPARRDAREALDRLRAAAGRPK